MINHSGEKLLILTHSAEEPHTQGTDTSGEYEQGPPSNSKKLYLKSSTKLLTLSPCFEYLWKLTEIPSPIILAMLVTNSLTHGLTN